MSQKKELPLSLIEHLSIIEDPRKEINREHELLDILVIAICASICGVEHFTEMELFANAKREFFESFLRLPGGIPSHDTFNRVLGAISPKQFQLAFQRWTESLCTHLGKQTVSIDGKVLRASKSKTKNLSPITMVSAWSSENKLVLAQLKTDSKSNEITAIPELLEALALKGCLVTIDAIGCQKEIAAQIRDQGGHYVLPVKENQKKLYAAIERIFAEAAEGDLKTYGIKEYITEEKGHGREETRIHWTTSNLEGLEMKEDWKDLKCIGLVERRRKVNGEETSQYHYYISSRKLGEKEFARVIRSHWGIENKVHWILDVAFKEDQCRLREGYAAENFAVLRHISLNLLKKDTSKKVGIKSKRKCCGWDHAYLLKVLSG